MTKPRRCPERHPSHPEVRCEERVGHLDEQRPHFHSFYMKTWDEEAAVLLHGLPVTERLDYLRGEIEAERISYSEIAELQGLADQIDPSDVVLLEWAGVPEGDNDGR